jgi:hypothetical protein
MPKEIARYCLFKVVDEDLKGNQLVGTNRTRLSHAPNFSFIFSATTFSSCLLTSFLHFFTPAPSFLLPLFFTVSYKLVQTCIFYPELFCNVSGYNFYNIAYFPSDIKYSPALFCSIFRVIMFIKCDVKHSKKIYLTSAQGTQICDFLFIIQKIIRAFNGALVLIHKIELYLLH